MTFNFSVPTPAGIPLDFAAGIGDVIFVLGANGTGKSSLIQKFSTMHQGHTRRISAHRQTWFDSNAMNLSARGRKEAEQRIVSLDSQPNSRWMEHDAAQRANIAIYDLIDAENMRARAIAGAVDDDDICLARELSKKDAPIKIINEILRLSNFPIEISVNESDHIMASKSAGPKYSISEMSDGERNALLIATSVLTAKPGSILLIDEPERHLHRSIISPLLTLLFLKRADCIFIVSTHDVMLPLGNPSARTLLVRGCRYIGNAVTDWDADLVSNEAAIDDQLKQDILGGRRKLLFVEGHERSLDKPLYSLIFPQVSVIAKSSCRDVEHAVSGIRDAQGLHWLRAFGIVDSDRRTPDDLQNLLNKGVYPIPVISVESIYYAPDLQRRVVGRHATVTGADPNLAVQRGRTEAIAAIRPHIQRLSERVVEATVRRELMTKLPRQADIATSQIFSVIIDVPSIVSDEIERLTQACDTNDLAEIIAHYPVRETPALDRIVTCLGFQNRSQYESAVRKLLMDDEEALASVKALFGTLVTGMATP